MFPCLSFALLACLFSSVSAAAAAELTFSTEPPAAYRKSIATLLTPAEKVLAAAAGVDARLAAGESGSVLLDETIYWVAENGAVFRAEHQIYRANSEGAVEGAARNENPFNSRSQKIHLVLARALPPGGAWQAVKPDAVFVQSPQEDQDSALYSDAAELVVVFPQIRPGSVTEQIVLIEEPVFRIPGELTALLYFSPGWAADRVRYVVDLPAALAARLAETRVGAAPAARRQDLGGGRSRFEWTAENLPAWRGEPSMAPASVTGPVVWLSTVESWDRVADWYRGLLADRGQLPDALRTEARAWTAEARSPEEIVRILHRKVADDIRYTGLEFGVAGYQPKKPAEVWADGYGDCKDKANLLRVLLADQGITSTLALVNTRHAGAVETRSPDFRHFDHAILAIDTPKGYLWADPTIPFLDPGQLGPGDAERQAFLIPEGRGWRFATTPAAGAAHVEAEGEVRLGAGGALEGWLAFEVDSARAASYREYLQGDEFHRLRRAETLVRRFFPEADAIDLEIEPTPRGRFRAKVFFSEAGAAQAAAGEESLLARDGGWLGATLDQSGPRRSAFFQPTERIAVRLAYRLPDGLAPAELPPPFEIAVPALRSQADWSCEPGLCRVELLQEVRLPLVAPAEFPAFLQAKRALGAWLRRPVRLATGGGPATAPPPAALADFPLMPTGAGQLRLLESRYPEGANDALRRAALVKVAQWFPNDRQTLFEADMLLGTLDCENEVADVRAGGATRLRAGLARSDASPTEIAWGRYLLAICAGVEDAEAIPLLAAVADDETLVEDRRGWSLLAWLNKIEKTSPDQAMALADRALALSGAVAEDSLFAALAWSSKGRLAARRGGPELDAAVEAALAGAHREEIAGRLAATAEGLGQAGDAAAGERLARALERVAGRSAELAPVVAELRQSLAARESGSQRTAIAAELTRIFADSPPSWWEAQPQDRGETQAAAEKRLEELGEEAPIPPYVRQVVHVLSTYPDTTEFSARLFQVAFIFAEHFPDTPQVEKLISLLDQLPESDIYHWEGRLLAGQRMARRGDAAGAIRYYRAQLAEPGLPEAFGSVFAATLGDTQLAAGHYAEAAKSYARLEAIADLRLPIVVDGLLRAALLELASGRPAEAWRYLAKLRQVEESVVAESASPSQVAGLAALAADENAAHAVFKGAESWWPSWLELEKKIGLPPAAAPLVPVLGDLEKLRAQLRAQIPQADALPAFENLRRVAHAARWDPALAIELSGMLVYLVSQRPDFAEPMRETAIAVLRAQPASGEVQKDAKNDLLLAAQLFDSGEREEAHRLALSVIDRRVGGAVHQRALLLLALSATAAGGDRPRVADELAAALDDSYPPDVRGMAAVLLAKLYRQLERHGEERALVEREMRHPAIAGTAREAELAALLATSHGARGDDFGEAFAAWTARFEPFLAYAEPASLEDPRLAGKKTASLLEGGDWLEPEKVKIAFLAAADVRRPVAERSEILGESLFSLGASLPRQSRYRQMLQALLDDRRFPPGLRSTAALCFGLSLMRRENLAGLDAFLALPDLPLAARQRELLTFYRGLIEMKAKGSAAIGKQAEELLASPLDEMQARAFPELWKLLVLLGEEGAAERLEPRLETLRTASADPEKESELQFAARRARAENADLRRAFDALRGLLLASRTPPARPVEIDDVGELAVLESLRPEVCHRLLLYDLATLDLGAADSLEWVRRFVFCTEEKEGKIPRDLGLALIDVFDSDERRADVILKTLGMMSVDQPATASFLAELGGRIEPSQNRSWQMLRVMEIRSILRQGGKVSFAAEAEPLEPGALRLLRFLQLRILLRDRDVKAAQAFLSSLSPAELKNRMGLVERLQLVRMLPPEAPERRLVESAARRQAYLSMLGALTVASWTDGQQAIRLSAELDGQASYPRPWLEKVLSLVDHEVGRTFLLLADAEARQDWAAAYDNAGKAIAATPLDYSDQWSLGRAAFHLGKREEARKALRLLVERAPDHPQLGPAREMLAQLGG